MSSKKSFTLFSYFMVRTQLIQDHTSKYPSDKEKFVKRIDVLQKSINLGVEYRRSIAICDNVIPRILRVIQILDEKAILLEEDAWMDTKRRQLKIQSRNITWSKYAEMTEKSVFKPDETNPNWTVFEQHGSIDIKGLGRFGRVIEMFAESFLHAGVKRSLNIMEDLLARRSAALDKNTGPVKTSSVPDVQSESTFV